MPHNHIPDPHSVAIARCRQFEEFGDVSSLVEMDYDDDVTGKKQKKNHLSCIIVLVWFLQTAKIPRCLPPVWCRWPPNKPGSTFACATIVAAYSNSNSWRSRRLFGLFLIKSKAVWVRHVFRAQYTSIFDFSVRASGVS